MIRQRSAGHRVSGWFVGIFVFAFLLVGLPNAQAAEPATTLLSVEDARQDLDDFQRQLTQRFAYLSANNVDVNKVIRQAKEAITAPISIADFSDRIARLVAMFIDGHAGPRLHTDAGFELPFRIEMSGSRYVAVRPDRTGFVDAAAPFIRRIGGLSIERWIAAADPYLPVGSPQLIRRRAVRAIQQFEVLAAALDVRTDGKIAVELYGANGKGSHHLVSLVRKNGAASALVAEAASGILPGNIGYLRIPSFSRTADVPALVDEWMPQFRRTRALLIDVRGNGGGNRAGLLALFPYFLREGESRIANVSAYRLYPEFDEDHLSNTRYSYRERDGRWQPWEREAIEKFRKTFKPEWAHPGTEFSDWHYLLLSKRPGDPRYYYGKDVYVLIDDGCFSATDIFAGAFKGFRNTLLVGQPTSGGSARSVTEELPRSGVPVRLASMVSFQPDGQLYDGRGVYPDIHIDATPESLLTNGEDNVLGYVLQLIDSGEEDRIDE